MILLLDNKDSFVWNLAQALMALGAEITVRRSDDVAVDGLGGHRALVLSPGPGRPEDAGVCVAAVQRWSGAMPILGVCLGHQAIGHALGAAVVRGEPCHGRTGSVRHRGDGLYAGVPDGAPFCRYHSLRLEPATVPQELVVDSWLDDGTIMGVRHRHHPTFGVQFHPESFRSPHGRTLLANFLREAA